MVLEAVQDLRQFSYSISTHCRLLDESLVASTEDPRLDMQEPRDICSQIDANARYARMALDDLLHALDLSEPQDKARALREIEGGFRFIRLAASEILLHLRDLARQTP
jgi:hypothetical protein